MALLKSRRAIAMLVALLLSVGSANAAPQRAAGAFAIKAAFIHNFTRFVEWPASAPPAPIVIGLVGDDPFGGSLDDTLRGPGQRIVLRRLRWNDPLTGCHLVFISASELPHLTQILESLRGASVLTVGDFDRFAARGGMIELRIIDGKVRFDINRAAAETAHLKISSKLLDLARNVVNEPKAARR